MIRGRLDFVVAVHDLQGRLRLAIARLELGPRGLCRPSCCLTVWEYISAYKFLNHTFRSIVGNIGTRLEFEVAVLGAHVGVRGDPDVRSQNGDLELQPRPHVPRSYVREYQR